MSSIINEIQQYLVQYRTTLKGTELPLDRLTVEDVSMLKGCQVRSSKIQEQDYKRGWAKLAKAQRLNRLMDYHARLTSDYQLSSEQQTQLKSLFYQTDFNKDAICYNASEGIISSIHGLKRDKDGIFYLEDDVHDKVLVLDVTKRTVTPVIRKFEPITQPKSKPIIKRKIEVQTKK